MALSVLVYTIMSITVPTITQHTHINPGLSQLPLTMMDILGCQPRLMDAIIGGSTIIPSFGFSMVLSVEKNYHIVEYTPKSLSGHPL
jgi:hypothetical protein